MCIIICMYIIILYVFVWYVGLYVYDVMCVSYNKCVLCVKWYVCMLLYYYICVDIHDACCNHVYVLWVL